MIRLYVYRGSQAASLVHANIDGAIRYIDTFESTTVDDQAKIDQVKVWLRVVAEAMDMSETLVFVEEEVHLCNLDQGEER